MLMVLYAAFDFFGHMSNDIIVPASKMAMKASTMAWNINEKNSTLEIPRKADFSRKFCDKNSFKSIVSH